MPMLSLCTIVSEPPVLVNGAAGDARVALDAVVKPRHPVERHGLMDYCSKKHVVLAFSFTS